MKRCTDRILTTHCGSLPGPTDLFEIMDARLIEVSYDNVAYHRRVQVFLTAIAQD